MLIRIRQNARRRRRASAARVIAIMAAMIWSGLPAAAAEPTQAETKADANAYFRKTAKYAWFIATNKGTRGWDNTSVRMIKNGFVKSVSSDGCKLTIAHDKADLGDPRNGTHREGPATITIDWGQVVEIDESALHADPIETGFLLRGGIETSLGSRPALRILGTLGSGLVDWAFHAKSLQRICHSEISPR